MERILHEAVDIIVKNFAPDKVILFGLALVQRGVLWGGDGEVGDSPEFVADLTGLYNQANQLEQKRNDLKANSMEATAEQEKIMSVE